MRVRIRRFGKLRFPSASGPECSGAFVAERVYLRRVVLSSFTRTLQRWPCRGRHLEHTSEIRDIHSPFRSALRIEAVRGAPKLAATVASADFSLRRVILPLDVVLSDMRRDLPR